MDTIELLNEVCHQVNEDTTILKKRIEKLERIIKILKNSYDGVYAKGSIRETIVKHSWENLSKKIKEFTELVL